MDSVDFSQKRRDSAQVASRSIEAKIRRLPTLGLRWPIRLARPTSNHFPVPIVNVSVASEEVVNIVTTGAVGPRLSDMDEVLVAEVDVAMGHSRRGRVVSRSTVPFFQRGHCAHCNGESEDDRSVVHL